MEEGQTGMNTMRDFRRALRSLNGKPMAYQIRDGFGSSLAGLLERTARGERVHDAEILQAFAVEDIDAMNERAAKLAAPVIVPSGRQGKSIAIVSMRGVAMYDCEYQPICFSTLNLARTMNALAADETIGTIILDCDSPGGMVTGTPEAADAVWAARQAGKNVISVISPLCASALYWICSQSNEMWAVPSADIGSLGVFMLHVECAKMLEESGVKPTFIFAKLSPFKVEGNPYEALSPDARDYYQAETDTIMDMFLKAVSRGRGVPVATVITDFGQGRTMMAPDAKKAGMIDRVATIDVALGKLGVPQMGDDMANRRRRGEGDDPTPAAIDPGEALWSASYPKPDEQAGAPAAETQPEATDIHAAQSSARARRIALLSA
jgi:signal peptide peptidase SppA